ncbi:MAG: hypothetical protein D6677_09675 [Calditrichaeota bacterium]|nr:MAG: hypothetical protein D6677_09675 [Calditrichota bacterium]
MYKIVSLLLLGAFCAYGQGVSADSLQARIQKLEKEIRSIKQQQEADALEKLRREAGEAANISQKDESKNKVFRTGQRSLQAINPEMSFTGDAYALSVLNGKGYNDAERSGMGYRVLGLHVQAGLDPFSLAKAVVEFNPEEGVEFAEVYVTWNNLIKGVTLTAGKFRQQFGVLNRWHDHALDQYDYPLALTTILGEEGLNQTGISVDWLMPGIWADAQTLTMQLTNGSNEQLFSGEAFSFPALLVHLKNYYDINDATYFELGLSGMSGSNDGRIGLPRRDASTVLAGVDATLFWEPVNRSHYTSFLWRSALFYADKRQSDLQIKAAGVYSYMEYRLNERWYAGLRWDYTQPFEMDNSDKSITQWAPYVTWWQSHWARFRLEYIYAAAHNTEAPDNTLRLQLTWAVGPHKHERY